MKWGQWSRLPLLMSKHTQFLFKDSIFYQNDKIFPSVWKQRQNDSQFSRSQPIYSQALNIEYQFAKIKCLYGAERDRVIYRRGGTIQHFLNANIPWIGDYGLCLSEICNDIVISLCIYAEIMSIPPAHPSTLQFPYLCIPLCIG